VPLVVGGGRVSSLFLMNGVVLLLWYYCLKSSKRGDVVICDNEFACDVGCLSRACPDLGVKQKKGNSNGKFK
jgi:hypothetical protein